MHADPLLTFLRDARLANHAFAPVPVWLWAADATRVLWANAAGAAVLGAANPRVLAERRLSAAHPLASHVARLTGTLPHGGASRLERLPGIGALGSTVVCVCSRFALANGTPAILIAANETGGPTLPLAERVARLFAGSDAPIAAFDADGVLLHATPSAAAHLGEAKTLAALEAAGIAAAERIGTGAVSVLILALPAKQVVESPPHPDPLPEGHPATLASRGPLSGEREHAPPSEQRKHPLRFVWQIDADGRFTLGSDEFVEAMGPRTAAVVGKTWPEARGALGLDPENRVEPAIASRETWSGIHVAWPRDGAAAPVDVELSGLPTFDRDRAYSGYRGFGICRDVAALNAAAANRASPDAPTAPAPETQVESRPLLTVVPAVKNVVPFRAAGPAAAEKRPALTPVERTNFSEIAKALGAPQADEAAAASEPEPKSPAPAAPVVDQITSDAAPAADLPDRLDDAERALRAREAENRELKSIIDTATDGVVVIAGDGRIADLSRSAEALFGTNADELRGRPFAELFAPESRAAAQGYLDGFGRDGVASVLAPGREVIGRARQGGLIPLFMTLGRIGESGDKFCAVLRDLTHWKSAQEELLESQRRAERASAAKSDLLAKISHEIRTPLNTVLGFSEMMMEEQFGPIGNARYRDYAKDIHTAGGQLVSLINDLLDLSKIEAGSLDLTFASVNLNGLVQQCVALMQPQANRERVIIRTSLAPNLPPVVADARSIRQIVLNLLSSSIKFTGAGGQVIVATAAGEHAAILRVRDTGSGMSEKEIEAALAPFRRLATSTRWGSGDAGLGLPLTKALAEANGASFAIKSAVNAGTLVEIGFAPARVPAS